MTDNLEELERLLAKATRGPWIADKHEIRHPDGPEKWGIPGGPQERANCAAIVALRNAAPSLVATAREVEGLRAALQQIEQKVEDTAYCVQADTPKTPFTDALNDIHEIARAALEGAEAPQSPIPLELKPIHFRLLERGANSRYIGLSNNSGVRMGEHAALGQLMRAGLVRFTEDSQPPGPRMPTPCEITDAGRAALEGKGG